MKGQNSQVLSVKKVPMIFFVSFWINRLHPRSAGYRIGLAWRTADQHPWVLITGYERNTLINFVRIDLSQFSAPSFCGGRFGLFLIPGIKILKRELASQRVVVFFRHVPFIKLAEKAAQAECLVGPFIHLHGKTNVENMLPVRVGEGCKAFTEASGAREQINDWDHLSLTGFSGGDCRSRPTTARASRARRG
jgi:hypothetical protein